MSLEDFGWSSVFAAALAVGEQAGRIALAARGHYRLWTSEAEVAAVPAGKLAKERASPVVGDWVVWEGTQTVRVVRVLPRRSQLSRKAAGARTEEQVLAANVDTGFLVSGLDADLNLRRIERYVFMARLSGVEPVIVLNKADLALDLPGTLAEVARCAPGAPSWPSARSATIRPLP